MKMLGKIGLAVLLVLFFSFTASARNDLPNFIIILADDLGYGDLSCYGSKTIATPRLDRMAGQGIRFSDFHVSAPMCSPSRASLLTGRYAQRAGLPFVLFPTERKGLPREEITLAEMLKAKGYATACIGKWHLGFLASFRPKQQGFDYFFGLPYSNDSAKQPANEPLHPVLAPEELPLMRNDEILEAPAHQETLTRRYTEEAIAFIEKHKDRRFFLYLPHTFPHKPVYASEKFRGKSKGGLYGDAVEELDWSTGQILDTLKELKLDEKTLVVFTSDNGAAPSGRESKFGKERGGGGSNDPLRGRKFTCYEGGFRTPCIVRWPGRIPAGRVSDELVTLMDFFPTFDSLTTEITPAKQRHRTPPPRELFGSHQSTSGIRLDGKNIWPILAGEKNARTPHEVFAYYLDLQLQAIRVGDWKLFLPQDAVPKPTTIMYDTNQKALTNHFPLRSKPELYNLRQDIAESRNVAEQNPDTVARLTRVAQEFNAELQQNKRPECVVPR